MDLQKIKGLIDLLAESRLAELELIEGDEKIRLVKTHRRATSDASEDIPRAARSTPAEEAVQAVPPVAASRYIH